MDWWIILLITLASIAVGSALGIPISILVIRRKEKLFYQEWKRRELIDEKYQSATYVPVNEVSPLTESINVRSSEVTEAPAEPEKFPKHFLIVEVEKNLIQAREYSNGEPMPFATQSWDEKYEGNPILPEYLQNELSKAYLEINLANNVAWLWNDLGSRNPGLKEMYAELCAKIADILDNVRYLLGI
ncbi:hypothetical protein ACFLV6_01355 [Chloroflexota bacterium]